MKHTALALTILTATGLGPALAHDLVSLNGRAMDHQHVEQAGRYGSTPRQGHYAKPPGSANGILIFSAGQPNSFGTLVPLEDVSGLPGRTGSLHQKFETGMMKHRVGDSGSQ